MITFKESLGLIGPYVKERVIEQVKAVAVIILYLVFFQTMILGIPIAQASTIAFGLSLVVVGLTFFMEGLILGLMPLGEVIGLKLPQKSKLPVILVFAFILGMGATFAEPAISVLKAAGASVKAWEAPLLYLILNKHSDILVYSVGVGVGAAVVFGMMRFMYNWSLKPFIYTLVGGVTALSIWGYFDPNILQLTGLAWDCGAVTTGPVTVPLVLALGIGISRVVGGGDSESGGFGVVTLASLFPILTVILLGMTFVGQVPAPMAQQDFFSQKNREKAASIFTSEDEYKAYALQNASQAAVLSAFDGNLVERNNFVREVSQNPQKKLAAFGQNGFEKWVSHHGSESDKVLVFGSLDNAVKAGKNLAGGGFDAIALLKSQAMAAMQAIIPLSLFLMVTLWVVLKDRLPKKDEIFLGIAFATFGMGIFNIGIELGLNRMGGQVGSVLPSAYKKIELSQSKTKIDNFDPALIQTAIETNGEKSRFFYSKVKDDYIQVPYKDQDFNKSTKEYTFSPTKGPLFGSEGGITGIIVVLLFAFFMGYGATLAEPALNALGATVETITVGNFKKNLLMQAVALGVGAGILLGVAKIIWNIPLIFMLAPPYIALMFITFLSTEEFVNIGWDSAGVTTGPITVPLVLAMGLGIGAQSGVVEGFGILAMASVCPILSVLSVGLYVTSKRKKAAQSAPSEIKESESDNNPNLKRA